MMRDETGESNRFDVSLRFDKDELCLLKRSV